MTTRPAGAGLGILAAGPAPDLCLAFANTKSWRGTPSPHEELAAPGDLLRWCESQHVLDQDTLNEIGGRWRTEPGEAEAALSGAIAVREVVFRMFAAVATDTAPTGADLDAFNAALRTAPVRSHLSRAGGGYVWALRTPARHRAMLTASVLWSAGDLLAGGALKRVRQCANPQCLWLFLDDSKSGSRRWCSMASCGNRAKAQRHYATRRQRPSTGEGGLL